LTIERSYDDMMVGPRITWLWSSSG